MFFRWVLPAASAWLAGDIIRGFEGKALETVAELSAIATQPLKLWRLRVTRGVRELAIGGG